MGGGADDGNRWWFLSCKVCGAKLINSGHQSDHAGTILPPPENSPALRNTRVMQNDMVFTIEPGLYFIPLLLEAERNSTKGNLINWKLIDELYPYGGIRIEDNVRVCDETAENLTRQFE